MITTLENYSSSMHYFILIPTYITDNSCNVKWYAHFNCFTTLAKGVHLSIDKFYKLMFNILVSKCLFIIFRILYAHIIHCKCNNMVI